ncbi:hypothetical protein [Sorangium atrum]|uniref:Secreted protein n=1 Tax=Sorangium atrum TaxID=2995308 RepID=A0ABT5BTM4_9BACT|nr:hypothetical protein [Sorangium aterium]MDC0677518.1 hypothetical protein [Sorangium aterium]
MALPLLTAACIGAELDEQAEGLVGEEELVGEAEGELISTNGFLSNALLPNALLPNALLPNALLPNALLPNALLPNALLPNALTAIKDPGTTGAVSRELLRYIVSCSLRPDQTFSFSWTDSSGVAHPEVYRGDLGYAHWWASGGISNDTYVQHQISACLAARVNWYGVTVSISLRNNEMSSSPAERAAYPVREGAFWGNVFASTPYLGACYDSVGYARARQLQRDCAAGHVETNPTTGEVTWQQCGSMVIWGSCNQLCNGIDTNGGYFRGCVTNYVVSPYVRTDQVVTTFLTAAP